MPDDPQRARQLSIVVSEVFAQPVPAQPLAGQQTVLDALGAGIGAQLVVLDDASLTISAKAALSGDGLGQLLARSAEHRKWLRSERGFA